MIERLAGELKKVGQPDLVKGNGVEMENPIYIKLMNEDVDVWRPVIATKQSDSKFLIEAQLIPDCEVWQFQPGQVVLCQRRHLSGGWCLVAARRIDNIETCVDGSVDEYIA